MERNIRSLRRWLLTNKKAAATKTPCTAAKRKMEVQVSKEGSFMLCKNRSGKSNGVNPDQVLHFTTQIPTSWQVRTPSNWYS